MEHKNSGRKGTDDGMTNPRQDAEMTPGKWRFITNKSCELKSYKATAYQKDPNPNAISASLYLSPIVPSYE